ncbi:6772_t:CDS:2, partial [Funneliformis caledonium]
MESEEESDASTFESEIDSDEDLITQINKQKGEKMKDESIRKTPNLQKKK